MFPIRLKAFILRVPVVVPLKALGKPTGKIISKVPGHKAPCFHWFNF